MTERVTEMMNGLWHFLAASLKTSLRTLAGAIAFYTLIPIPKFITLEFQYVSRVAPVIGSIIGLLLSAGDMALDVLGMPVFTRSALVVVLWMVITGGLHMDGAMDTADGLAVMHPDRRLEVMADSRSGAFGVMMAIALVVLKVAALSDVSTQRGLWLVLATTWGRWGQQIAIAQYPYLKATGKGAFHKAAMSSPWIGRFSMLYILGIHGLGIMRQPEMWKVMILAFVIGGAIALAVGYWLYRRLGGHTGDTYGAVVEITETGVLAIATVFPINQQFFT